MVEPAARADGGAGRGQAWPVALLAVAVCAAYASAFQGGFQFDDWRVIVGDPRVASLGAWWSSMPGIRPLLKLTYALDHQAGLGLAGFHATNLAFHLASALLAAALLLRLGRRLPRPLPPAAALVGALVFALHPVQTEAVTYLSGRSSALSGMLALASVLAFASGRDAGRPLRAHLLSPLLMLLSLAVKEGAVALPAALWLVEAIDLRRPFAWRATLRATSVHLAVAAAAACALVSSPTYRAMLAGSLSLRPFGPEVLTHARAVAWLATQLVPVRGLSADPALAPVAGGELGPALAALAVLVAAAAGLLLLRRRPVAGFAICWFLCWLAPQGWWLPRPELASERQLYVALLGPAWAAGALLACAPWPRIVRTSLAAGLALALGVGTAARNRVYRDEVTFWSDAVAKAPHGARAHANLGYALALACRPEEATRELLRAAQLDPEDPTPLVNLRLLREGALLPDGSRCPDARGEQRAR